MLHKLHILFLPSWFPVKQDPLNGVFNRELAELLSTQHQISLLHIVFAEVSQIEITHTKVNGNYNEIVAYLPNKGNPILRQWRYFRTFFQQARAIRQAHGKPDILHVLVAWKMGLPAFMLKLRHRIPLLITEHFTGYMPQDGQLKGYKKWWSYLFLKNANRVVTVSESLEKVLRHNKVKRIQTIHNRIHDLFLNHKINQKEPSNPYTFIHISNFNDRQKQTSLIADTFIALHKKHPNTLLKLMVPTVAFEEFQQSRNLTQHSGIVHVEQGKPRKEFLVELERADILVSYSLYETFGLTIAEALCIGLPVIYTKCGGPENYVEGRMGMEVDPLDTQSLYNAMEKAMLEHPFSADEIGEIARSKFGSNAILMEYNKVYSQLIPK